MSAESPSIVVESILECVPFSFAFDREGRIVRLGAYLQAHHPEFVGRRYDDAFAVVQGERTFERLTDERVGSGMQCTKERVEIRLPQGELSLVGALLPQNGPHEGGVFIGTIAPSLISQVTQLGLTMSDFAPFDVAADLAMMAQVNEATLKDLRLLNERLAAARDEAVSAHAKMEAIALVDVLSGLGNRAAFQSLVAADVAADEASETKASSLLLIDIDNFKPVNDNYGHATGDEILHWVGMAIAGAVKDRAKAYRLGGDNFAVVFEATSPHQASQISSEVMRAINRTFIVFGRRIAIGASAGLASRMFGINDLESLYKAADIALHDAKRSRRAKLQIFTATLGRRELETKLLERDLFDAIETQELEICVQPVFDLQTRELWGGEALVRWWNRRLERYIPPAVFIPIAERYGLISKIDLSVFSRIVAHRNVMGGKACQISWSTNFSPLTIQRRDLRKELRDILDRQGPLCVPLTIEITERTIGSEAERIRATLRAIREMGIELAMDDFGAGQTSLAQLTRLPITRLKIDRSLVEKVDNDERSETITRSIIKLAHELGLRVTAEGIERQSQADRLERMGPMKVQGFLFARPMPLQEFTDWVEAGDVAPMPAAEAVSR